MEQEVGTLAPQASAQIVAGWARVRGRLREEVGDSEYKRRLRQMTLLADEADEVEIQLPTRFMRDWVNSHYGDRLRVLWQAEYPAVRRVELRISQGGAPDATAAIGSPDDALPATADAKGLAESLSPPRPAEARAPAVAGGAAEARSDWVAPLESRFTFDTFIVGKPNEFAHACARRVSERPA
ncbi:MAG: chromosomal replication initiator protein DnaA, partial [Acetobacteraceae bacterium]|nr:chromosomal replication initiator protein DnaA [Acetobacteraceae bacterium]